MSRSDSNSSLGFPIIGRKRPSSQVTRNDSEYLTRENMPRTEKVKRPESERDFSSASEVPSTSACISGPCASGRGSYSSGRDPCSSGRDPCSSGRGPYTSGRGSCSSGRGPCSSGRFRKRAVALEGFHDGCTRNPNMAHFGVISSSSSTSRESPSLTSSVPVQWPRFTNRETVFSDSIQSMPEPQERVVIPTFSEHAADVVSERSLLLHRRPKQNRPDRHVPTSRFSSTGPTMSSTGPTMSSTGPTMSSTGPTMSSTIRDSFRSMPTHLVPRNDESSVVSTTVTSNSDPVFYNTNRESFAPLDTDTSNFSSEPDHTGSGYLSDISENGSSISLSDLFEFEETAMRFRRPRTQGPRMQGSLASLFDIRDSDSDLMEDNLRSNSVYGTQLDHVSSTSGNVPELSSDTSESSSITISDSVDHGSDRSSISVEEVGVHVDTSNLNRVESRPEVIVVGDSSDEEDVVFIGTSGREPVGPEIFVTRDLEQLRPWPFWNIPPARVFNVRLDQPPPAALFNRHPDISFSFSMDSQRMSFEDFLNLADRIGPARVRGLSRKTINALPVRKFGTSQSTNSASNSMSGTSCPVCMADYSRNEHIKCLPCLHEFHSKCIGRWLKDNRTCPVCRYILSDTHT